MSEIKITLAAFADEAAGDLQGQIRAMKRNGLTHIEIRNTDKINCADLTAARAKEIRKQLDAEGLKIKTVGSPVGKIKITDDFAPEMERFLRLTETAEILGADKIRMFSFYRDPALSEQEGRERVLERLKKYCDRAGSLLLCHENEKDIYGDGWEFCRIICESLPKIRAVFDFANFVQCGVDTKTAWENLKEFVEYIHLKDALPNRVVVPCGEGVGNVSEILGDYLSRGGRFATLEPHLYAFSAKKLLEKNADTTCANSYQSENEAFDAAVVAAKKLLREKGARAV